MQQKDCRARLLQRTDRRLAALGDAQPELEGRRGQPPRPGEVFVFAATREHDVEWVVVESRPGDPVVYLLVAADTLPWVGARDVGIAAGAPCGPLSVRCGHAAWIEATAFDPDLRTGVLDNDSLERIRRRRAEVEAGAAPASLPEQDAEQAPEYREWSARHLDPAVSALLAAASAEPEAERGAGDLWASGIDATSGLYLPSLAPALLVESVRDEIPDPSVIQWLRQVHGAATRPQLGPGDRLTPEETGWAMVCHSSESAAVREALEPLLEHRRGRAGGAAAATLEYRTGESLQEWLARHGVSAGEPRPAKVPRHLLLVGPPSRIPFDFQALLSVEYAVGRLSFETPAEYRRYAEGVVEHEGRQRPVGERSAVVFGPWHPTDSAGRLAVEGLLEPLAEGLHTAKAAGFAVQRILGEAATRANLSDALRGPAAPNLLISAGHAVAFPPDHPEQPRAQGALLCRDWPGSGPIAPVHSFGAADVAGDARVRGLIAMFFSSFSAGTSSTEPTAATPSARLAEQPFVSALARRLLAHPAGPALAVIGFAGRVWGGAGEAPVGIAPESHREALAALVAGETVGEALRQLKLRDAAASTALAGMAERLGYGGQLPAADVASAWAERSEARGLVVLGDPAVRLGG